MPEENKPDEMRRPPDEPDVGQIFRDVYAQARGMFSDEDLDKYEREEPMVPFEQVLEEMQAISEETRKRRLL